MKSTEYQYYQTSVVETASRCLYTLFMAHNTCFLYLLRKYGTSEIILNAVGTDIYMEWLLPDPSNGGTWLSYYRYCPIHNRLPYA